MVTKPKNFEQVLAGNYCRWLGGKIGKTEYCGHKLQPGQSYCEKHMAIVYRTQPQKKGESDGQK